MRLIQMVTGSTMVIGILAFGFTNLSSRLGAEAPRGLKPVAREFRERGIERGGAITLRSSSITAGGAVCSGGEFRAAGASGLTVSGAASGGEFTASSGFAATVTCGPCRLYGDLAFPYCLLDVDDILLGLDSFIDPVNIPDGDIEPCGGDDDLDVDDVLALLAAFTEFYTCPHPCPP